MHLSDLHIGQQATIISLAAGDQSYRKRLISLGLLPGTSFIVSHIAPLGDPIEIQVRGLALSLRKHEAAILTVEVLA
jgi:ferrous iron transport protein A